MADNALDAIVTRRKVYPRLVSLRKQRGARSAPNLMTLTTDLPPELRVYIWQYAMGICGTAIESSQHPCAICSMHEQQRNTGHSDILPVEHDCTSTPAFTKALLQPPLTRVNKALRSETLQVFYGDNTFKLDPHFRITSRWLVHIAPLQKLSVLRCDVRCFAMHRDSLEKMEGFDALVEARRWVSSSRSEAFERLSEGPEGVSFAKLNFESIWDERQSTKLSSRLHRDQQCLEYRRAEA